MVTPNDLETISRIYDVVLDPTHWTDVLDRLANASGAGGTNLVFSDHGFSEIKVEAVNSLFAQGAADQEYNENYAQSEARALQNALTFPHQQLFTGEDACEGIIPFEELPTAMWLKEKYGLFSRNWSRLNNHAAWFDVIAFHFPLDRGCMSKAEKEHMGVFLPHIAKAVELTRPFIILKARFQAVLTTLDHFHIGVFILSERGNVLVKNAEADRILDLSDGLSQDQGGMLRANAEKDRTVLERAVQIASSTSIGAGTDSGSSFTLDRPSGSDPFLMQVAPLNEPKGEIGFAIHGALVFVIDPENRSVISTEGMELLYGLTEAEAAICRLMIDGHATNAMADIRNVSPETIKSQIKSIMAKTGSRHRSDIIRQALTVNLPVDKSDKP